MKTILLVFRLLAGLLSASAAWAAPELTNLSIRGNVSPGNGVIILGFTITGSETMTVLIRGIGPTLGFAPFNVPGALPDPKLTLRTANSLQGVLAVNDNWLGNVAQQRAALDSGAFAIAPGSKDAVILIALPPGGYTVVLEPSENNQTAGIGLIELYNVSRATGLNPASRLSNMSVRLTGIGSGAQSAFAGFVVDGIGTLPVMIRGGGPALAAFGVPNIMSNPAIFVYNGLGLLVNSNTNWNSSTVTSAMFAQLGAFAFASGSLDTALREEVVANGPTSRTVGVPGTGAFIIEIYRF